MASITTIYDGLSNWEFINHFNVDDDERIYELVESIDSLSSTSSSDEKEEEKEDDHVLFDVNCFRVSDLSGEVRDCVGNHDKNDDHVLFDVNCFRVSDLDGEVRDKNDGFSEYFNGSSIISHGNDDHNHDDDDDDEDDDDDDGDDGYGMDDELVPWEVKDRLRRQRIRKSGKNSIGRLAKSKKSALVFTRPGCVRGKHGLGLKVY